MEKPSWTTVAIGAVAAVAVGVAIYMIAKDDDESFDLDDAKYSKENLLKLLRESELEYTCIYTRYYNIIMKMKERKEFNPQRLMQLE